MAVVDCRMATGWGDVVRFYSPKGLDFMIGYCYDDEWKEPPEWDAAPIHFKLKDLPSLIEVLAGIMADPRTLTGGVVPFPPPDGEEK